MELRLLTWHSRLETTSPLGSSKADSPGAPARDGAGHFRPSQSPSPGSPALSDASTADGQGEIESSPALPPLPAPSLPRRAQQLLRTPSPGPIDETQFGTASWGSPYPRADLNLRPQSFSSDASDESLIHTLDIDTPFLRPAPEILRSEDAAADADDDADPTSAISAAAAVLANRARRPNRGLTEDWIRTHTTGDLNNTEPRHWFSDGSGSEHSSLSGSEFGWLDERNPRTPRATKAIKHAARRIIRHTRGESSTETLRPSPRARRIVKMATSEVEPVVRDTADNKEPEVPPTENDALRPSSPTKEALGTNGPAKLPLTPSMKVDKPLPKEPAATPRIKKKVPWKGKNIMVLLPRDEDRGLPGKAPKPLRQDEIQKMFASWEELGYGVDGFDLLVEGYQPPGTDDSQSREAWPTGEDLIQERSQQNYKVTLPDLNGKITIFLPTS